LLWGGGGSFCARNESKMMFKTLGGNPRTPVLVTSLTSDWTGKKET